MDIPYSLLVLPSFTALHAIRIVGKDAQSKVRKIAQSKAKQSQATESFTKVNNTRQSKAKDSEAKQCKVKHNPKKHIKENAGNATYE